MCRICVILINSWFFFIYSQLNFLCWSKSNHSDVSHTVLCCTCSLSVANSLICLSFLSSNGSPKINLTVINNSRFVSQIDLEIPKIFWPGERIHNVPRNLIALMVINRAGEGRGIVSVRESRALATRCCYQLKQVQDSIHATVYYRLSNIDRLLTHKTTLCVVVVYGCAM